ncbi:DNA repair exonuclease SbcCD nuclease subunit [Methanococcoides vulcani]|uniref:DNA double-strand break repair protein Mre11 n=1 Tax=Methanococcoides vulcani TaxID=1353158 RepID=A0A1H9Y160_9EURY|nr:exonuclease SbcCD subunit D [Methanococcoides vulcani]SES62415.1 DNA repair exonuclease SbcCD nuclease subunit [Methanococcoides vulcani]
MEREIRILHTADTHIGYRQYHSEVRRQDFIDAFSRVIDDAVEMKMDAVIHAGDLFDSRNPTLEDILDTINILSKLKQYNIPFLSIVGNHESKQHTQWLDLFESMEIAIRLGTDPYRIEDVAIYGIDNVPRSKIQLFDYSKFTDENCGEYNIVVMHQLMSPFPFGEWDCEEVIKGLPFEVHAILLGDYHKNEKTKVDQTWVTYCGSTERNSASESDARTYNIITINDNGIDIGRRNILTREFLFIPVELRDRDTAYELIINSIKEYDVSEKVVFVDISGNPEVAISYNEIEEFLASQNALVTRIRDMRRGEDILEDKAVEVSFSDPDEAVKREIRKMTLTSGGIMIDEIVRDPDVPKTKVDLEAETRIGNLLSSIDFMQPGTHMIPKNTETDADTETGTPVDEIYALESVNDQKVAENTDEYNASTGTEKGTAPEDIISQDEAELSRTCEETEEELSEPPGNSAPTKKKVEAPKPKQYNLGDYL